jgi:hypothetical protein
MTQFFGGVEARRSRRMHRRATQCDGTRKVFRDEAADSISRARCRGGRIWLCWCGVMTRDAEKAYVQRWMETGQLLADLRWRELRALDAADALRISDHLIEAALRVPLPASRRQWSGLVEWQDSLHARRSS